MNRTRPFRAESTSSAASPATSASAPPTTTAARPRGRDRSRPVGDHLATSRGSDVLRIRRAGNSAGCAAGVGHAVANATGLVGATTSGSGSVRIRRRPRLTVSGSILVLRIPPPVGILDIRPIPGARSVQSAIPSRPVGASVEGTRVKRSTPWSAVIRSTVVGSATIRAVSAGTERGHDREDENRQKQAEEIVHPGIQSEIASGFNSVCGSAVF